MSSRALIGKCTHLLSFQMRSKSLFFSSVETTYEEDANRDAEVPVGVGGAGAVNMTLAVALAEEEEMR